MSEAQLVFLFIVPMCSESWYVRVALSANHSLHTQSMDLPGTLGGKKTKRMLLFEETLVAKSF